MIWIKTGREFTEKIADVGCAVAGSAVVGRRRAVRAAPVVRREGRIGSGGKGAAGSGERRRRSGGEGPVVLAWMSGGGISGSYKC